MQIIIIAILYSQIVNVNLPIPLKLENIIIS